MLRKVASHLLEASFVGTRLHDGGLRLTRDHIDALAHPLHALDDVVLPHVVDDPHHLSQSIVMHARMQQSRVNDRSDIPKSPRHSPVYPCTKNNV